MFIHIWFGFLFPTFRGETCNLGKLSIDWLQFIRWENLFRDAQITYIFSKNWYNPYVDLARKFTYTWKCITQKRKKFTSLHIPIYEHDVSLRYFTLICIFLFYLLQESLYFVVVLIRMKMKNGFHVYCRAERQEVSYNDLKSSPHLQKYFTQHWRHF